MKAIELSTALKPLSAYAEELRDETIVLTLNGTPIAVVTSIKDIDSESLALSTNPDFLAIIERSRAELRAGKKLSLEEMKAETF
jgi:PHD/YefM family antitoxin component YafN of YafNO toxin-antitoxin module